MHHDRRKKVEKHALTLTVLRYPASKCTSYPVPPLLHRFVHLQTSANVNQYLPRSFIPVQSKFLMQELTRISTLSFPYAVQLRSKRVIPLEAGSNFVV